MKKLLLLLLMLPMVAFAQSGKDQKSKYEDFMSKSGNVCTILEYNLPPLEVASAYGTTPEKISFTIQKFSIANSSLSFLQIFHTRWDEASSAMIEASDVKLMLNAIKEIKGKKDSPVPEGATAQYLFLGNDGVTVKLKGKDRDIWEIKLERYTKDDISIKDIDSFIGKLEEIVQKMDSIK